MLAVSIKAGLVHRLLSIPFVRESMGEKADLAMLRAKPKPAVFIGLGLVALSYIIGWPAVGLLAVIAYNLSEPVILAVGGPLTYGLSHIVFLVGCWLAGPQYVQTILRWAARMVVEKLDGKAGSEASIGSGGLSPAHLAGFASLAIAGVLLFIRQEMAVIPLGGFLLFCLVAPFLPQAGLFLPVTSRGRGNGRTVALTFDDGPDSRVTPRLLDLLDRYNLPATFFVAGAKAEQHPGIIRETLLRGHTIGNHSYSHDPLLMLRSRKRLALEIKRAQDLLAGFGIRPYLFRPPVGITNPRLAGILRELDMSCVTFSCRAGDFGNRRIKWLVKTILARVHPGAIILLHDVCPPGQGTDYWHEAVEQVILGLRSGGYEIVPLTRIIGRPVMEVLEER